MASAQTAAAVSYSPDQLLQLAQQMREQAKNSKDAETGILEKHLDSSTILAIRDRDGKAELHQQFGDVFVVLQGTATLVTGGTIASPTTTAPGEIRGASIEQGDTEEATGGRHSAHSSGCSSSTGARCRAWHVYLFRSENSGEIRTSSGKVRTRLAFTREDPRSQTRDLGTSRIQRGICLSNPTNCKISPAEPALSCRNGDRLK